MVQCCYIKVNCLQNNHNGHPIYLSSGIILCMPPANGRCYNVTSFLITVYPKKYAHGFVVLCFVVVMQSFIMNSHEVFIHIHQGCFAGTGAIVRLPQCQWSKPDGYGKISQCITTTKHCKAKNMCIFLGIYCSWAHTQNDPCVFSNKSFLDLNSIIHLQLIPQKAENIINLQLR